MPLLDLHGTAQKSLNSHILAVRNCENAASHSRMYCRHTNQSTQA